MTRHEHEWDEPLFEPDNGYVYISQGCMWREVVGSSTSERLDETFYEYGAGCEAERHITYLMSETVEDAKHHFVEKDLGDSWDRSRIAKALGVEIEYEDDAYIALFDEAYPKFKENFLMEADILYDDGFPNEVTVGVGEWTNSKGITVPRFKVTFELEHVDEDVY